MKTVILSGGKGTRLGLVDKPKPMVEIAGRPLLEWTVRKAVECGFNDIVLLNGHLAHVIEDHFGDGSKFGAQITHFTESKPLGTAGAVAQAKDILKEPFFVIYGDILMDVDLAKFRDHAIRKGGIGSIFAHPNDHPYDSDLIEIDDNQRITTFHLKPHGDSDLHANLVSAALYMLTPQALDFVPTDVSCDWCHDVFPTAISQGADLFAYKTSEYAKDMGTPERLAKGEQDIASGKVDRLSLRSPRRAVFLDRDGVLNVEKSGVHKPSDLDLIEGSATAVKKLNQAGLLAICVTNQPDIAKGRFSFQDLHEVHKQLDTSLASEGAYLDDLYFCPHHPEAGWPGERKELKIICDCRKPNSGMLDQARREHDLDLSKSYIIGDRYTDLAAGRKVGTKTILVKTGHDGNDRDNFDFEPDFVFSNIGEAISFVLEDAKV